MVYSVADQTFQTYTGVRKVWAVVASVFLIILLVAAGVMIERGARKKKEELQQFAPSGFRELQKSSYAISETSGQYTQPRTIVGISDWDVVSLPQIGIELAVPPHWEHVSGSLDGDSVEFTFSSSIYGPKLFRISLFGNTKRYTSRDFVWREMLGFDSPVTDGVREGTVELTGLWLIDGEEGFTTYYTEGEQTGSYMAVPKGSEMLVLFAQDFRFTPANKELFSVLSTIQFFE